MKAFVITLRGNEYSERKAARCIESAAQFGTIVERFDAVPASEAHAVMESRGLKWTWANGNTSEAVCPISKLKQHPYGKLDAKIGCSMSHYILWEMCDEGDEPFLILEHDAVFLRQPPNPGIWLKWICQINDPRGATPKGTWWSDYMAERGNGVFPKTNIFFDGRPDGLAGNSAYFIQPWAAEGLIKDCHKLGLWPNDAIMCRQRIPWLQELYPFVTKVEQEQSTTS